MRYAIKNFALALLALPVVASCSQEAVPFHSVNNRVGTPTEIPSGDAGGDIIKTFRSGTVGNVDLTMDSGFQLIRQDFQLRQEPKQQEQQIQLDRKRMESNFVQGHSGVSASQSFMVSEAGVFDLLLVIDNSSSMGLYQKRLSKTLPDILRHISNTNWRIAVVTTSTPCLSKTKDGRRYLTRADYDSDSVKANEDFIHMITVGEFGSTVERGILMATSGMLEEGCTSESNAWLRSDSQRSVLLLSDEKNCGSADNEGCPGQPYELAKYFFDKVGYNVTVNALLLLQEPPNANAADPDDPNHDCKNSGGYSTAPNPAEYVKVVQETGGIVQDICRSDYSVVLDQISQNVSKKINAKFELKDAAVAESVQLTIDGKKVNNFSVSGKTLTILDALSAQNGTLQVSYKHDPVPMLKAFAPDQSYDPETFEVYVNGNALPSTGFTFNSKSGLVELKDTPPERAAVKIRYRENIPLRKVFQYTQDFVDGSLEVKVDGVTIQGFKYDSATKTITLDKAPRDAQVVNMAYELPTHKKLTYPVQGVFSDGIEFFELHDKKTGEIVDASLENGIITVPREVVWEGRDVQAVYNLNYEFEDNTFVVAAEELPFQGSLKIEAAGSAEICGRDLSIKDGKISFKCSDEDFENIKVQYQYAEDYTNSFDVGVSYAGPKSYKVYVNGQETEAFHVLGEQLVLLKKDLPPDSEVKVIVHPE